MLRLIKPCFIVGVLLFGGVMVSVGGSPALVVCGSDSGPVLLQLPFPTTSHATPIVLVDPKGREIFSKSGPIITVSPGYKDRVKNLSFQRDRLEFSLEDNERELAGRFSCHFNSASGEYVPDCGQTLHYLELTQPKIVGSNTVVEGSTAELICISPDVSSYSDLGLTFMYTWFKDSSLTSRQRKGQLTIQSAGQSDEGDYSCRVAETSRMCPPSAQSSPLTLVLLKPPKVRIEPEPEGGLLKRPTSESVTLTCVVDSALPLVPTDGFSWTFVPSDHGPGQQLQETGNTLTLGPLTRKDSGRYTCQARNDQTVKLRDLQGNSSVALLITYLEKLLLTSHVEVREGESFTLSCSVDSSPTALLQWLVDGLEQRRVRANVDNFVVMATTVRDSGNYTCLATNGNFPPLWSTTTVKCVDCRAEDMKVKAAPSTNTTAVDESRMTRLQRTHSMTPDIIALIVAAVGVLAVVVIVVSILLRSLRCQISARDPEPGQGEQRFSLLLMTSS